MTTLAEMIAVQRDLVIDQFLAGNPVAWVDPGFRYDVGPSLGRPNGRTELRAVLALPANDMTLGSQKVAPGAWVVVDLSPEDSDFELLSRERRKDPSWKRDEVVERLTLARGFVDIDPEWLRQFCKQCTKRRAKSTAFLFQVGERASVQAAQIVNGFVPAAAVRRTMNTRAATAAGLRRLRSAERRG